MSNRFLPVLSVASLVLLTLGASVGGVGGSGEIDKSAHGDLWYLHTPAIGGGIETARIDAGGTELGAPGDMPSWLLGY